ncbi:MAG: biosynthetic peptidoglycan transglycosylase [Romboutsia sp.]
MSYDDNKIRRRKVSSTNSVSRPLPREKGYERNKEVNTINREKSKEKRYFDDYEIEDRYNQEYRSKRSRVSKTRVEKNKKRRLKLIKAMLVSMLSLLVIVSTVGLGLVFLVTKDSPPVTKELIHSSYVTNNTVSINDIPVNLKNAIVSIEDERFYKHNGVDIISLTRSVLNNLLTDTTQGGSTIDMQVSKNLLTNEDKTIQRKIRDIYNAIQMNKVMSKDEILEAYLNNIYLGRSSYGVEQGSKAYFGKSVSDLSLAQSAMLIGITNNPARYKEHREAKKRQETVLYKMNELGYITDIEYKKALREEIPFVSEIGR